MTNRAFTTTLLTATLVLLGTPGGVVSADDVGAAVAGTDETDLDPDDDTTRPTVNEFLPEERPLGDCLSSLPKPDCGSRARGGWAQRVVFAAIVAGLAFIAWRVVAGSRRARRGGGGSAAVTSGTRDATTVPDGDGGDPAP